MPPGATSCLVPHDDRAGGVLGVDRCSPVPSFSVCSVKTVAPARVSTTYDSMCSYVPCPRLVLLKKLSLASWIWLCCTCMQECIHCATVSPLRASRLSSAWCLAIDNSPELRHWNILSGLLSRDQTKIARIVPCDVARLPREVCTFCGAACLVHSLFVTQFVPG